MEIHESFFANFPKIGAVSIEIDDIGIEVIGSIFTKCNNDKAGGALRLIISTSKCVLNRTCATYCHTNVAFGEQDYGHFLSSKTKRILSAVFFRFHCALKILLVLLITDQFL